MNARKIFFIFLIMLAGVAIGGIVSSAPSDTNTNEVKVLVISHADGIPQDSVRSGGTKVVRDNSKCPTTGLVPCGTEGCPCEFCDLFVMTNNILEKIFKLAGVIASLMIIVGGVLFLFAGAKPSALTQAKGIIFSVVIGLLIIFSAWIIINTIFEKTEVINMPTGWKWYEIECK